MGSGADGDEDGGRVDGDIAEVVSVRVDGIKETNVGGVEEGGIVGVRWFPVLVDERTRWD